jgi:DNA-binding NtrC family response regulator
VNAATQVEGTPQTATTGATVLVVDDDASVRTLVSKALTRAGFDVVTAADARSAQSAAAARSDIALLVLDVNVPGGGGRRLGAALGLCCPEAAVIYTSGFPSDLVEDQGVITSSSTFLAKPFSVDELVTAVRNGIGADA